jgi:hypothetical protein
MLKDEPKKHKFNKIISKPEQISQTWVNPGFEFNQ